MLHSLAEVSAQEEKAHPEFAAINAKHAFVFSKNNYEIPVTLGYVLHVMRKVANKGDHQFLILAEKYRFADKVLAMWNAWKELNQKE